MKLGQFIVMVQWGHSYSYVIGNFETREAADHAAHQYRDPRNHTKRGAHPTVYVYEQKLERVPGG